MRWIVFKAQVQVTDIIVTLLGQDGFETKFQTKFQEQSFKQYLPKVSLKK